MVTHRTAAWRGAGWRATGPHRGDLRLRLSPRRRGYDTVVCPDLKGSTVPGVGLGPGITPHPDSALPNWPGRPLHVEVQRGDSGTAQKRVVKWRNLFWLQGVVAICAATPAQAQRYAAEARGGQAGHGLVTDLVSLPRAIRGCGPTSGSGKSRWSRTGRRRRQADGRRRTGTREIVQTTTAQAQSYECSQVVRLR